MEPREMSLLYFQSSLPSLESRIRRERGLLSLFIFSGAVRGGVHAASRVLVIREIDSTLIIPVNQLHHITTSTLIKVSSAQRSQQKDLIQHRSQTSKHPEKRPIPILLTLLVLLLSISDVASSSADDWCSADVPAGGDNY
jgi:hypothetical protein